MKVGPYAIIEAGTIVGDGTEIMAHANILTGATVGKNCRIFHGAVVCAKPQDLKYDGGPTFFKTGDDCIIREYATLNGSTEDQPSRLGSNVLLMAYVHIGHDTQIGDNVIVANSVQMGGFVNIDDHASIGGGTPIHQFCHIGTHAFIGGGYRIVQDVPPYILAMGEPLKFSGLNSVGLRRNGFDPDIMTQIKRAYHHIYRSGILLSEAVEQIRAEIPQSQAVNKILEFVENSNRGLI